VFSYDGYVRFGTTGDYETTADIDVFARGLAEGARELSRAATAEVESRGDARESRVAS
jgi:hypothetical protein